MIKCTRQWYRDTLFSGILLFMIFYGPVQAQASSAGEYIKNLDAPSLGITSSTAILIWDDIFEADLSNEAYQVNAKSYTIYQDGLKIATTNKHTYTAKGLLPGYTYTFSVCLTANGDNKFLEENSIKVSTKEAGKVINVKSTGAAGNGITKDTEAIQQAIDKCEKGGTVLIPAGTYLTGHLELKSDMTLEIAKGALLTFIDFDEIRNLPVKKRSLISGINVHRVVVTGEGTIDANGESWWPFFPPGTESVDGVSRPSALQFVSSSEILIQGITIQDSPKFNNVLSNVDDVVYSDVKFFKFSTVPGRNGDALDPYASRNILIVGCVFGNQDDSIAIKGNDKEDRFSEHITIMDCVFDGNAAPGAHPLGFAIGSGCKVRHVLLKNCVFIDAASIANIKTNRNAFYTFAEDIRIENVTYINTKHKDEIWNRAPIAIDQFYYGPEGSSPSVRQPVTPQTPVFRDIQFRNIKIDNPVGRGIYLAGFAELPIKRVVFDKVIVNSRDGISVQNVDELSMQSVQVRPSH